MLPTRRIVLSLAVLAASSVGAPRLHAQVIDRSNTAVTVGNGFSYIDNSIAVVFKQSASFFAGAGLYLANWYNSGPHTGTLYASLYSGTPMSGTLLASGSSGFVTPTGYFAGSFFDVFFPVIGVTAGQDYSLVFHAAVDAAGTVVTTYNSDFSQESGIIYSGVDYRNRYSLNFREYSDATVSTTATPEPASIALFATGLCALGLFARKRRQA